MISGKMQDGVVNGSEGDSSSAESTPTKHVPFSAVFSVQVSDAVKDGDTLQFTILSTRVGDETGMVITRVFDDVEWLHHCLVTQTNVDGIIVPPLPQRPEVDPKSAESISKKQLGSDTRILKGDEFSKHCRTVEKYLRLLLKHESFGKNEVLAKFLTEKEAPVRAKLKKGIMTKFSSTMEEVRKGGHRDIEDYFHKRREWAAEWGKAIKEVSGNFNKMVCSQHRVAGSFSHLATALTWTGPYKDDATIEISKVFIKLSEALNDARHGLEVLCNNDEKTLGFQLDLYARYSDSLKDMLLRRTCLLIDYEDANKALEKAKPPKLQAAEEHKQAAEKAYENCTENARREMKLFLQQRLLSFEDGLTSFAESQIKTARDTYTLLMASLSAIRQMN